MDDLIQLVFFGLLILFGLLSSRGKKKQRQPPAKRVPRPERAPADRTEVRRPPAPAPEPARVETVDEFFDLLMGTKRRPPPVPPAPTVEVIDDEARSLETLEPAGEASHRRFHDKYLPDPSSPITGTRPLRIGPRRRLGLSGGRRLRDAIVLIEVLGPPKAMGDGVDGGTSAWWSKPLA